jgi:magnesium transporter
MTTKYDFPTVSQEVIQLLHEKPAELAQALSRLHAVDRAVIFQGLEDDDQEKFIQALGPVELASLLEHLTSQWRAAAAVRIPEEVLPTVLDSMTSDDAADVLQGLLKEKVEPLLLRMRTAGAVRPLLQYGPETAGGLMTHGYVEAPPETTVADALALQRSEDMRNVEVYYYVYVTTAGHRLEGVASLRDMLRADPSTALADVMRREVIHLPANADQEECARLVQRYRLRALPVVSGEGILLGVITSDDIMDIITEEDTEDMYKMAGVGVREWAFSPLGESIKRRVPWLSFNMAWAFAGAAIISLFEGTLDRVATVAIFMPMIAGQAGNAGIQTATIVVRSMALGEVHPRDMFRLLRKEWALGATKGAIFGSALGLIAWVWKGNVYLGAIAGLALFLNMLVASTAGVLLPMTLRRLGFDPATIAGVFDTMLTDFMGFLIYLGLATIFISQIAK